MTISTLRAKSHFRGGRGYVNRPLLSSEPRPSHTCCPSVSAGRLSEFCLTGAEKETRRSRVHVPHVHRAPRHATSDGLFLPRVPSAFRLRADPGGRAGTRRDQLYAGGWRSGGEDQHDRQLHVQWLPGRVPADRLWRLLRWVIRDCPLHYS